MSEALHVCPGCGLNLTTEAPTESGPFRYDPRVGMSYEGAILPLGPSRHLLMGTLLRAGGRTLPIDALIGAIGGEDSDNGYGLVQTHICLIRKALREAGVPSPIATVWGKGFRWSHNAESLAA